MSSEDTTTEVNGEEVTENAPALSEEDILKEEIKKFSLNALDSSLRNQEIILTALSKTIDRAQALPEPYAKGLIKLATTVAVRRYCQPNSFKLVNRLLLAVTKHDPQVALNSLATVISQLFPILPNISLSRAKSAVHPEKWLLNILSQNLAKDHLTAFSAFGSLAYYCSYDAALFALFQKRLNSWVKTLSLEDLEKGIEFVVKEGVVEKALCLTVAVSENDQFAATFVDLFSKYCLLAKTRPSQFVVDRCGSVLSYLSVKSFDELLLPNIKKGLLRSPEVALFGVRCAFKCVKFNLDAYVEDVSKAVSGSLGSADDEIRTEAVSVLVALSSNIGVDSIKKIVNRIFDQISAAKSSEQRVSFLNGISAMAENSVTSSPELDKLADEIISKTAKSEKETNEGTVAAQWEVAAQWATRLSTVSPALSKAFSEASKLPQTVRSIGYRALAKIIVSNDIKTLPSGAETTLWNELDNSQKDALDAIGLTTVLLRTSVAGSDKHRSAWEKIVKNEYLFKDKVFSSIGWKDAVLWAELVERILLDRPSKQSYPTMCLQSLSLLLFWPHWEVRKRASEVVKRVVKKEQTEFSIALIEHLYTSTVNDFTVQNLRKLPNIKTIDNWTPPGEWFVSVLNLVLTSTGENLPTLAIHCLLFASLPQLVVVDGAVWLRWIHSVDKENWESSEFFRREVVLSVLKCQQRPVRDNALITLVALNVTSLKVDLWNKIEEELKELDAKEYIKVSEKDVNIWKCREGQLYNMAALDIDEGEYSHNMKRENKAYSYQEQLQEIQLRRELAEKKRKEGKLTAKQKQVMEKELASEQVIRSEVQELYVVAERKLDLARALVAADPSDAFQRPHILFNHCLPFTKSFLVAEDAVKLFYAYRNSAFPSSEDYLGDVLASCWLKVVGSKFFDATWIGDSLEDALKRTISLLNERAYVIDDDDDTTELFDEFIGAPQLTFLYPFVRTILNEGYADHVKEACLQLLQNSMNKKFLRDNAVLQLPLLEYANLLLTYFTVHQEPICLKALTQLVGLANETLDIGERIVSMVQEMISYLTDTSPVVRESVLKMLSAPQLLTRLVIESENEPFILFCLVRLFVATFDESEDVAEGASLLWDTSRFNPRKTMGLPIVDECVSNVDIVRRSASLALSAYVQEFPEDMGAILNKIKEVYTDLYNIRPAVYDQVGRMTQDEVDEWAKRTGVGIALEQLAELVTIDHAETLIKIVVPAGLDDRNSICRSTMTKAAVNTIERHGVHLLPTLLPYLENLSDNTLPGAVHDNLRQGLVVLLGTLAQFLEPSSAKVKAIMARLLEILNTPSQSVQESVSKCLSPLVPAVREDCKNIVAKLQYVVVNGATYGERRGGAYGIGGLIKGMGMTCFAEVELMSTIQTAITDKKNWKAREGALLTLEMLCTIIGKLFEPYMLKVLPNLLLCFGDNDENVRKAAEDTARAMMTAISPHGTKLILPLLTKALDDDSWRTKCAATELLGSMAFCAPKQLSSCLPSIVPKLIDVLADSSSKVQKSGEKALRQIAKVIRNPEILGVTNQMMMGLLDPANKTNVALQAVLNTKFVHYIDAPSLALLMPIVRRAFEDRNSETRRYAAQIIANIYNLIEHKDMEPYLSELVPGLQKSLLDPVPEIRTVAARALGSIVSKSSGATSERLRESVIPWLKDKLVSPVSTVDRSGAAQGLSEVLAGVGTEQLDFVMPEIIAATESSEVSAETKDGYILMYIYLPMVFGDRFLPYLPHIVPPILKALADENEYVRASALKAGQRLIAQYCAQAKRLLLPQLLNSLMDDNWRIRYAAVQLVGDFLFNISGVTGKSTTSTANEDDTMGMEQAGKTIVRALGQQCRDRVIAGLYLVRSDVALTVRQAAGHVWKIVVSNTPRTLKEVMKILFELVVESLASPCEERQQMGARCLGELVRKMGDKIINEILPILEQNQKSDDMAKRIGVAMALHEIIDNMSKEVLNHYLSSLVSPVRNAICDELPEVREAAADTFSVLYQCVGHDALDEIITPLLEQLTPDQEHVLDGLCEVMKQNSRQMLPYLLPRLTKPPINVHALCSLASVAGDTLSRQLPRVLDALLAACKENNQYDPMIESCEKVVIAVTDEDGVPVLCDYLIQKASKGIVPAAVLFHTFVEKSGVQLNEQAENLLPGLLSLYASSNPEIVDHSILAAIGITQNLDSREMLELLPTIRKALRMTVNQAKGAAIPGFAHEKALQPLLPMMREGILQGGVDQKSMAGETLGLLVGLASPVSLKPHVVATTGPLIRVLGDRYPPTVKLPILETLSKLLDKVEAMLRPFLPQLQSTFVKALQETASRQVRLSAASALPKLLKIHPKPEPLVIELFKLLANSQDQQLSETSFVAAKGLILGAAPKLSPGTVQEGYRVCSMLFKESLDNASELDNSLTSCAGSLYGELAIRTKDEAALKDILSEVESSSTKPRVRQAKTIALEQTSISDPKFMWDNYPATSSALTSAFSGDSVVACAAIRAAASFLISQEDKPDKELLASLGKAINHQNVDVRKVTAIALGHIFKSGKVPFNNEYLRTVVPQLINGCKEANTAVRSAAELAVVYAFHMTSGDDVATNYASTIEGAAKGVLEETLVVIRRVIRNGDIELEALHNILSTC